MTARVAIVIGINRYTHYNNLTYCPSSAEDVYELLTDERYGGCDQERSVLWAKPDEDLTSEELYGLVRKAVGSLEANEQLIFYFSGHGEINNDDTLALITSDASRPAEGYQFSELIVALRNYNITKGILVIDSCHSAAMAKSLSMLQSNNWKPTDITKGFMFMAATDKYNSDEGIYARQDKDIERTIFSYYFCQGIRNGANSEREFTTLSELTKYINESIKKRYPYSRQQAHIPVTVDNADLWISRNPSAKHEGDTESDFRNARVTPIAPERDNQTVSNTISVLPNAQTWQIIGTFITVLIALGLMVYSQRDNIFGSGITTAMQTPSITKTAASIVVETPTSTSVPTPSIPDIFGSGKDGDIIINSGEEKYVDTVHSNLSSTADFKQKTVFVADTSGFNVGDEILIIQIQGKGAGNYEFSFVESVKPNALVLQDILFNTYAHDENAKSQVLQVPHFQNVTIESGGILTADPWNGHTGGIVAFRASGQTIVNGTITADHLGFRGNLEESGAELLGYRGEGTNGFNKVQSENSVDNGGGGGAWAGSNEICCEGSGGGGGGNGTPGERGYRDHDSGAEQLGGHGGKISGNEALTNMTFGGSGGEAYGHPNAGGQDVIGGKKGGGIVFIASTQIAIVGLVTANGEDTSTSTYYANRGGGGAGGSILIQGSEVTIGHNRVTATGGRSEPHSTEGDTAWGGEGGDGRIVIAYCDPLKGTSSPIAYEIERNC